jgi:hypothetical protein
MPPKKAIEAPPAAEAPDQPPSFDTDSFVDSLLMMAKKRELALLEDGVAAAVGMADDFRVNLRNGVVVDFTVECVLFASQHGFNARKTAGFIKWMTELRTCVETTGDIDKAKTLFRTHVIASAERNALASSAPPPQPAEEADGLGGKPPGGKTAATKGAASKAAVKPASSEAADPGASMRNVRSDSAIALTVQDIGHVADFVVAGVLQHWRLYHHVANADIASTMAADYRLYVQTPMAAPALTRAMPAEQYEAHQETLRRRADDELAQLQREEADRQLTEKADRERRDVEARLAEEEARANALYFEKQGTDKAVAHVHDEVQAELNTKQSSVMARLARIEELLQLQQL